MSLGAAEDGWTWRYDRETRFVTAVHANGRGLRSICEVSRNVDDGEAVGALLAAAPELLAALKAFVARYPNNVGAHDARRAIAKAEGV